MKKFSLSVLATLLLSFFTLNGATDMESLFTKRGVKGTLIISSLDGKKVWIHNKERSKKRLLPASTFKIPNTLIALELGAVKNPSEIIKWDGKTHGFKQWNRDHSLETAFPVSCVWFYQEIAKRVGKKRYEKVLKKIDYGNMVAGPDITRFWLDGDLKISALEQIEFLKKLYHEKLPFKKEHFGILKRIMVIKKNSNYTLRGKTGWAVRPEKQHGWYVGYVETGSKVWLFALNIDIKSNRDRLYRQEIVMEALKLKGIIKD